MFLVLCLGLRNNRNSNLKLALVQLHRFCLLALRKIHQHQKKIPTDFHVFILYISNQIFLLKIHLRKVRSLIRDHHKCYLVCTISPNSNSVSIIPSILVHLLPWTINYHGMQPSSELQECYTDFRLN